METPKLPILNYEARKVTPMSRKVLLAATGGVGAIMVAGVLYVAMPGRVTGCPGSPPPLTTGWVPASQPTTQPVADNAPDVPLPPER